MLRLIYDMYRTDTRNDYYYNILDLSKLQLRNDDLLAFNQKWDDMLTRVDPNDQHISYNVLGIVMERAIEHSSRMKEDFARYRRLHEGHPDRNYRWLYRRMTDEIDRKDHVANRATVQRATGGGDAPAAAPAKGTGKDKTNAKAKRKADVGPDDSRAPRGGDARGRGKGAESRQQSPRRGNTPGPAKCGQSRSPRGSKRESSCPRGTCREFWSSGKCNRDDCKYTHTKRPERSPSKGKRPPAVPARFASSFKQDVAPSGHDLSLIHI